jgi:hypothetical protein
MQRQPSGIEPAQSPSGSPAGKQPGPLLSIGLPVYNGAQHLRQSIDSLLAQDVGDLELVISDNASTDGTSGICLEYAAADSRVRYSRNAENIGAAANFNRAFDLCSGDYFMWGSDDDIWDPRFARSCIERLKHAPGAVQCTTDIVFIADDGEPVSDMPYRSIDTDGMPVEARVHELIARTGWFGTYSVIRPSALRATHGFLPVFGGDVLLLMELALLGDSLSVAEALFHYRQPNARKTAAEYVSEIRSQPPGTEDTEQIGEPYGFLARKLLGVISESNLDLPTVQRIRDDFVETLSTENTYWGRLILREQGLSLDELTITGAANTAMRAALGLDASPRSTSAWSMRSGMKLALARRALLRLLQPFTERQSAMDAESARKLEVLTREVSWLRRRVQAHEQRHADSDERR